MKLHFKQVGRAIPGRRPLVILHGLFGSCDNWLPVARALQDDHLIILPDLPNHGESPHTDTFSYPEMATAIADFVEDAGLSPCMLTGHSMGGKVAMATALERPEVVERLCLADIAPRQDPARHSQILAAMQDVEDAGVKNRRDAEEIMARRMRSERERAFLQKSLVEGDDGVYRWKLNLRLIRQAYETMLAWPYGPERGTVPYDGPTLFVAGGRSSYLHESDLPIIRPLFPQANVVEIADAGHWIHADQPEIFLDVYTRFLDRAS